MRRRSGDGRSNAGQRLKKARKEGRVIVFVDESGLSERPHCCRTWAPRGQTPLLQYHFNWKTLSAMAGVTWWNFYFRLFPGTIRSRGGVPTTSLTSSPLQAAGGLGRVAQPPECLGMGFRTPTEGVAVAGISPRVCPGTEPRGVPMVALEAA